MNASLDRLVCLLRDELLQHGELLALLERQQECGQQRRIEDILPATEALEVQCQTLHQSQQQRSEWQAEVARRTGLDHNTPLTDLIPALSADYRPVLEAFVAELEETCERTLHRLRQNHQLLNRSLEVMVRLLHAFGPADSLRVDTDRLDCCILGSKVNIPGLEAATPTLAELRSESDSGR